MSLKKYIRPIYFTTFFISTIIDTRITIIMFIIPNMFFTITGTIWITKNKKYEYTKAIPTLLILPFIQELSFYIGFITTYCGVKLQNAWKN